MEDYLGMCQASEFNCYTKQWYYPCVFRSLLRCTLWLYHIGKDKLLSLISVSRLNDNHSALQQQS